MPGILDKKYHDERNRRIDYKYRLNRRTDEVSNIIQSYFVKTDYNKIKCLDIGTADGLMLSKLNNLFNFEEALGIDASKDLIETNSDKKIELRVADAENMPFEDNHFDLVISCAVIEHVNNPDKMIKECLRVTKKNGILIITSPNPIHNKIAEKIKYFTKGEHIEPLSLKKIKELLRSNSFEVFLDKYFMFFPFFKLPLEKQIELIIRFFGMGKIMPNQLLAARKIR